MNIVMVIPVLSTGGAERVVSNLSLNLPNEITRYIVLYDASKISYPYKATIVNLNLPGSRNPLRKIYEFILRIKKLRKLKKDYNIKASVSFTENPNLINILARNKDKVIVSVRNYRSKEIKNEGILGVCYKLLLKLLYNKADLVVAVSQGIKQDLITNFKIKSDKIRVIYNAYDIPEIQNMAEEELEDEDKLIYKNPVIITVGRLSKQKGQWHLIRAFSMLNKTMPEVELIILGEGPFEKYLKDLSKNLGLEKKIHFLGFKKNPFAYVSKAKLFIMSSMFEGFPNSLAEAMVCGVPVISTDCKTGPREIFYDGKDLFYEKTRDIEFADSGILIPICDGNLYTENEPITEEEKIMAQSMIKVLQDENLRHNYSQKALKRVRDFSIETMTKEYTALFKNE